MAAAASSAPPHHSNYILPRRRTTAAAVSSPSTSHHRFFFSGHRVAVPILPLSASFLCSARRRPFPSQLKQNKRKNKSSSIVEDGPEDDPLEALFKKLEHDLANDDQMPDGNDDIDEVDLEKLDDEFKEVLGEDDEELMGEYSEDEVSDDEPEEQVKLKRWQLRRLAYALKKGKRRISIKDLCGELNLERPLVLELLREPPPELLMMSASLPDVPEPAFSTPETVEAEPVSGETETEPSEPTKPAEPTTPEPDVKLPIHVLQSMWAAQKRLKKAQVATLEKVYERSKRPTNTMISNISHLTNLPRKRIVQWFEEKRAADDLPQRHNPHRWVASESAFSKSKNAVVP